MRSEKDISILQVCVRACACEGESERASVCFSALGAAAEAPGGGDALGAGAKRTEQDNTVDMRDAGRLN